MLITLSEAARIEGSPSQPSLSRMTRNRVLPDFLKKTDGGWRVDTDDPAWENMLSGRRGGHPEKDLRKSRGARLARAGEKKGAKDSGDDEKDEEDAEWDKNVRKAIDGKIIYSAKREKLKMMQDEIKTSAMKGDFVERAEGEYWLSFMQRGIIDSFSAVDRCFAEMKRLILLGNDLDGKRYLKNELKAGFERAAHTLREAIEGTKDD
jgi:hypothetical protein